MTRRATPNHRPLRSVRPAALLLLSMLLAGLLGAVVTTPAGAAVAQPRISVGDLVVGESAGVVNVPVRLDDAGTNVVTVNYNFSNGFATINSDWSAPSSGTLSFAPGETTKLVPVTIVNDVNPEGFESFTLGLSVPVSSTIARAVGRVSIVDNDNTVTTPRLFVRDAVVDERAGSVTVPVVLGGPAGEASNLPVTVNYATAGVSGRPAATAGADFTAVSSSLTFAPGETVKNVPVTIAANDGAEGAEAFSVVLSAPSGATLGDTTGVVTIGANGATPVAQPRISVGDVVVGEGDGYVDVPVTLSAPGQNPVSVNYNFSNGFATINSDWLAPSNGTLVFAPGETLQYVRIDVLNDANPEGFESFTLGLSVPASSTIARAVGRVSIVDNDNTVTTPRLFVRDAVVDERAGSVTVPVVLGGPAGEASNLPVTVNYATAGVSGRPAATAGADFTAVSSSLTFARGETVKNVVIGIAPGVPADPAEPAEAFSVVLSAPSGATLGDATGVVVIGANGATPVAQPRISVGDLVVGEGDGYVDVPVTLSAPGQNPVSVNYNFSNGFATINSDWLAPSNGTLTFAPGETLQYVRIDVLNDANPEGFESFTLGLSVPASSTIARAVGRVSIVDNDNTVTTPRLFVRDAVVDERAGSVTVPVVLGGPAGEASNLPVTVNYATAPGTATVPDFTAVSSSLTFARGETVKNVVIGITANDGAEAAETFSVVLSAPSGATSGDATGVVTIGANGATPVAQPGISVGNVIAPEGAGYADVPVTLSAPGQNAVAVNYNFSNGTASINSDWLAPSSGTLTFAPGETLQYVRIDILQDVAWEGLESFTLGLSVPVSSTIVSGTARINVVDDDIAAVNVSYTTGYTAPENARLLSSAATNGQTAEQLQKNGVLLVDYLLLISHPRAAPVTAVPPSQVGAVATHTSSWTSTDIGYLQDVQAQFSFTPEQAQKFGVQLIEFLTGT